MQNAKGFASYGEGVCVCVQIVIGIVLILERDS